MDIASFPNDSGDLSPTNLFQNETLNIFKEIGRDLNLMRQNNQLLDGTIRTTNGGKFSVHIPLIAAISPYFNTLFSHAQETSPSHIKDVTVHDINSDIMEQIIEFCYTGKMSITMQNATSLIVASEKIQIPEMKNICVTYIINELSSKNCIEVYTFSKNHSCPELLEAAKSYILAHLMECFSHSSDFVYLSGNDFHSLIKCDELNARSEEMVFQAVVRWVDSNPNEGIKYLPNLLNCIRFGFCSNAFYFGNVENHPYIEASSECKAILNRASKLIKDLLLPQGTLAVNISEPLLRPRAPYEIIFAIGGWSTGSATCALETYDIRSNRWFFSHFSDSMPRAYHGLVALNGLIYMIGGFDGNMCFNTVRCFNPVTHEWKELACMYSPRCYVSVALVDNYIYALGGYDGHIRVNTGERYNVQTNQWRKIATMNHVRSDASAGTLNNKVYIVGGFNGQHVLNTAEVYDPFQNKWTDIRVMSIPRSGVSLITFGNYIYVLGGFNGSNRLSTVEKYCTLRNVWMPVPSMLTPRSNFSTSVVEEKLFAIGGFNGNTTIAAVESFDTKENVWREVASMNINRSALSACVLVGLPNRKDYSYIGQVRQ